MGDHPIIFSGPMIRALLESRKTMTRRLAKRPDGRPFPWQRVKPGDRLWVRESISYWERPDPKESITPRSNESSRPADGKRYERWMRRVMAQELSGEDFLVYLADDARRSLGEWRHPHPIYEHCVGRFDKTITAIHMPRWASRLTLEVTATKIERLQEISEEDAVAEGMRPARRLHCGGLNNHPIEDFCDLWAHLHGKGSWHVNPEVAALTFRVIKANIDHLPKEAA